MIRIGSNFRNRKPKESRKKGNTMKMRKVLSLILCLCMVFVLLPSAAIAADSEGEFKEEGGELYFYQSLDFTRTDTYGNEWSYTMKYKLDSTTQTATCMGVNGAVNVFTGEEELRILDTITYQDVEYTVTAVGEYAFQYNKAKVITLPDTITRIEAYAFDHCEKAESINIPSSVTYIGRAAFNTCTALKEIVIPDGITEIPASAFMGCWAVSSLTIPDSVTTIGQQAFMNFGYKADEPMDVIIPNSVTSIENNAFRSANIKSVTFPAGRTETLTVDDAFPSCSKLEMVTVLTGLVSFTTNVEFRGCSSTAVALIPTSGNNLVSVPTGIKYTANEDGRTVTITHVLRTALDSTPAQIGDWYVSAVPAAYQSVGKHVCYFGENNALKYCTICGVENENHICDWTGEWLSDENGHWHECTCGDKNDEAAHTFTWILESETAVSETGHEECEDCGYEKASVKLPKTAPAQPAYDDLSNGDSNHTAIEVILHCVEDGTTCYDAHLKLFDNTDSRDGYTLGEVAWDTTTGRWYCDVTVYAKDYIAHYSGTKGGDYTAHELAQGEVASQVIRFWYREEYAQKGVNPWRAEDGSSVTFQLTHTKIARTITCTVISVTKDSVELSAEASQLADDWEFIYYAVSDTPDTVPSASEFSIFSSFENLKPDTTYYFWAKVGKDNQTGLQEAVSRPIQVTTDHDWDTAWSGDDTHHWHECTADGCTITGNSQKLGYGVHTGGTATCHTKAVCDECGEEYGAFNAANHDGGTEERNSVAATCTEDGYTGDTYCIGCGERIAEGSVIAAFGHTLTHCERVEATCTTEGNAEHWHCSACGKYFADAEGTSEIPDIVIPMLDHAYGREWKFDDTNHWHECACGAKAGEAAHNFTWVTDREATETEAGSKHEECEDCGYREAAVEIPATGGGTAEPVNPPDPTEPAAPSRPTDPASPQTGDGSGLTLWLFLLFLAGSGLAGTALYSRRKNFNG